MRTQRAFLTEPNLKMNMYSKTCFYYSTYLTEDCLFFFACYFEVNCIFFRYAFFYLIFTYFTSASILVGLLSINQHKPYKSQGEIRLLEQLHLIRIKTYTYLYKHKLK